MVHLITPASGPTLLSGSRPSSFRIGANLGLALAIPLISALMPCIGSAATPEISSSEMQAIYEEVRTPYKQGIILEPEPGKKLDCPNVFRAEGKWYMMYVQLEPAPSEGYTTQFAVSDDLLKWQPLGTVLPPGEAGSWDHANAAGGVALFDTAWGGTNELQPFNGRYWLSYLGGQGFGYETTPLSIGLATTETVSIPQAWQKISKPVLSSRDPGARPHEFETLYKSYIFQDAERSLGARFVMFYNAKPSGRGATERIFTAVSDDMTTWRRVGAEPVIENLHADPKRGAISGDPQVVKIGSLWVMFYFGAFWKPDAFDTFAASRDLVTWTKWTGEDLIKPSEPYDARFAHKPWLIKHDGVVYHFYCAVGGPNDHRAIAVATSKDLRGAK
jgi:predicted GH43/DUF377 family glycosyl hydrolase